MLVDNGIDLKTYYAHNNYMNMPRLFTDEYKNVVWSGDFTPFGELYNENGSVSNVIRFAGQYENLESGYFYNYHRDYDAGLGRYLQSDPIGLNGGINTYAYVKGNSINFNDPKGLKLTVSKGIQKELNKIMNSSQNKKNNYVFTNIVNYLKKSDNLYFIGDTHEFFNEQALKYNAPESEENAFENAVYDSLANAHGSQNYMYYPDNGFGVAAANCQSTGGTLKTGLGAVLAHELMHFYDHATGKLTKMERLERELRADKLANFYIDFMPTDYKGDSYEGHQQKRKRTRERSRLTKYTDSNAINRE